MQDGDHGLARLLAGHSLDGQGDDLAGALLAVPLRRCLDIPHDQGRLALGLVLDNGDEFGLGLLGGEASDALQHLAALRAEFLELGPLAGDVPLQLVQAIGTLIDPAGVLVDPLLPLSQPGLPALQVAAEQLDLLLDGPDLVLHLAARLGGLLGGGLGPADDGAGLRLGPRPDLVCLPAGLSQHPLTLRVVLRAGEIRLRRTGRRLAG